MLETKIQSRKQASVLAGEGEERLFRGSDRRKDLSNFDKRFSQKSISMPVFAKNRFRCLFSPPKRYIKNN